jgi:hypothetical protein
MQGSIWNTADILAAIQARMTRTPAEFAPLAPHAGLGTAAG